MIIPRRKVVVSFEIIKDKKGVVLNPEVLSKTNQTEKDSVDINRIMKNHKENGGLLGNPFLQPLNGDFTQFGDYKTIKTKAAKADQAFMAQDPKIRMRFNNDPQEFFNFLADPKNDREAVELKLKHFDVLKTALADDGVNRTFLEPLLVPLSCQTSFPTFPGIMLKFETASHAPVTVREPPVIEVVPAVPVFMFITASSSGSIRPILGRISAPPISPTRVRALIAIAAATPAASPTLM